MDTKIARSGNFCYPRMQQIAVHAVIFSVLLPFLSRCGLGVISRGTGGVVVNTTHGPVLGETEDGVYVFRGIRFAESPTGKLRFRPPAPPTAWHEVRPALDFAPACPQIVEIDPTENNNSVMAEDCLAVNVWTPKTDGGKRPVMVFIHGGANIDGSARNTWYDGTTLAERGNLVLVTLQYRLGAWGYLELSEIGGKDYAESGNLGVLDQIAALKWVKDNIARFGGDPNNVTLFGQSAGGMATARLMGMPQARGLFQKAILESGAGSRGGTTTAQATDVAKAYMKLAGVSSVEELRQLSMVDMREAQRKLFETRFEDSSFGPVIDGVVLNKGSMDAIADSEGDNIPVMLGTVLDEMRYWSTIEDLPLEQKPEQLLRKQVADIVGDRAEEVIAAYKRNSTNYGDMIVQITSDLVFRLPAIELAELTSHRHQPTYMYLLTYRSTSSYRKYDSAHTMEIPFVFGVIDDLDVIAFTGRNPHRLALMKQVQQAWINFARLGNPNHPGLPAWPQYDENTRATMELGINSKVVNDPLSEDRQAWGRYPTKEHIGAIISENSDNATSGKQ